MRLESLVAMIGCMQLVLSQKFTSALRYVFLALTGLLLLGGTWLIYSVLFPTASPFIYVALAEAVAIVLLLTTYGLKLFVRNPNVNQRMLLASYEQFLSLYAHSPVPYVIVNTEGVMVMYNLAAVRLLRTTTDGLVGKSFIDRLTLEDENALSLVLGKINAGFPVTDAEVQVTAADGNLIWILLSVFVDTSSTQRMVSMVDITHQKVVDMAKSEFVALAAHQLRTPVSAIRWNLELLGKNLEPSVTPEQQNYLEKIARNVRRMIALIDDFLSVSKLETGTFATTMVRINLTDFFNAIVDEYTSEIATKELQVTKLYQPLNITFTTDTRLLHIITSNLLSNAVKYVPKGAAISFAYDWQGQQLTIRVTDNGIGIPTDQHDQLFTKFFRARNAQDQQAEGTGLGLYIVKESVEKLGGTISVISKEGVGTSFTVSLPYEA